MTATATATETWLTAEEAVAHVPGPPMHPSTLRRWASDGVRGRRLPSLRRGGRRFFRLSDIEKFIAETAADGDAVES